MLQVEQLEDLVLQWAADRGILQNSNVKVQGLKLMSELGELADNIAKGRDVTDDIGDCMVVLTIIAHMEGLNLRGCYEHAYEDIKDRKKEILKTIPSRRFGTVEDIADAVEFLISEKSNYITGQVIPVNGGVFT